jgi:hypothetical protein
MLTSIRLLAEMFGENNPIIKKIFDVGMIIIVILFTAGMISDSRKPIFDENKNFDNPILNYKIKKMNREFEANTLDSGLSYYQKYEICKSKNPSQNDDTNTDSGLVSYIENNKCKYMFNLSK